MSEAVYGQMITDPIALDSRNLDVEFHDDGPKNDWIGKQWELRAGEIKSDFPVVEVQGQTVRWIDAPGGLSASVKNTKMIVIVYAGACQRITHVKIFKIEYNEGVDPTLTELTEQQLGNEVKDFTFRKTN